MTAITGHNKWDNQVLSRQKGPETKRKLNATEKPKKNVVFFPKNGQHVSCEHSEMSKSGKLLASRCCKLHSIFTYSLTLRAMDSISYTFVKFQVLILLDF